MLQFVAVVRNHSITKAAEELFIAQPAISATLKKLESELSVDLFFYENKKMNLTVNGEKVYSIICNILSLYQELDDVSYRNSSDKLEKRISYYAAPSIHQCLTPQLQLFDVLPNFYFDLYDCSSLEEFHNASQDNKNCFGIFHILDSDLDIASHLFPDYNVEKLTSVPSCLMTSSRNSSKITKKDSLKFDQIKQLPLIQVQGTTHSIHEYLKDKGLNFTLTVTNSQFVGDILYKDPSLYTLGHSLYSVYDQHRLVSIPIIDLPNINLMYIYKNTPDTIEIFSRLSSILHSLFPH